MYKTTELEWTKMKTASCGFYFSLFYCSLFHFISFHFILA